MHTKAAHVRTEFLHYFLSRAFIFTSGAHDGTRQHPPLLHPFDWSPLHTTVCFYRPGLNHKLLRTFGWDGDGYNISEWDPWDEILVWRYLLGGMRKREHGVTTVHIGDMTCPDLSVCLLLICSGCFIIIPCCFIHSYIWVALTEKKTRHLSPSSSALCCLTVFLSPFIITEAKEPIPISCVFTSTSLPPLFFCTFLHPSLPPHLNFDPRQPVSSQ